MNFCINNDILREWLRMNYKKLKRPKAYEKG